MRKICLCLCVGNKVDQGMLRWFGQVERMEEEELAWRVYEFDVRETKRERLRREQIDSIQDILHARGLDIQRGKVECMIGVSDTMYVERFNALLMGLVCRRMKQL